MTNPLITEETAPDWHRTQAIEANNSIWELLESTDRSPSDDEELLRRAYASAYHWQRARGRAPENEARALYMLAKAHLAVGDAPAALRYADLCAGECAQHGLVDFDLAYAYEARARALRALGRTDEAAAAWAAAKAVPIADPEDQAILDTDLATGP
jgi:tetratricopeptide (TPR) repeat protein